ncbi:hypothetical protein BJX99DRAFT_254169 [Aspergillus californicus]
MAVKFTHRPNVFELLVNRPLVLDYRISSSRWISVSPHATAPVRLVPVGEKIIQESLELVKVLLGYGADPNSLCVYFTLASPVIFMAISFNSFEVVQLLLETDGLDINITVENGLTPFSWAIRDKRANMASLLLATGRVNRASRIDGLHFAIDGHHAETTALLGPIIDSLDDDAHGDATGDWDLGVVLNGLVRLAWAAGNERAIGDLLQRHERLETEKQDPLLLQMVFMNSAFGVTDFRGAVGGPTVDGLTVDEDVTYWDAVELTVCWWEYCSWGYC